MGYFSNGTEGDIYRARWCSSCANDGDDVHEIGCAVWDAHLWHNTDQFSNDKVKAILETLIPRDDKGGNGKCHMFRERT